MIENIDMIAATSLFPTTHGLKRRESRDWNCQRNATTAVFMKEFLNQVFIIILLFLASQDALEVMLVTE